MTETFIAIIVTFAVAGVWLRILWSIIPHREDKHLPTGLEAFFLLGLLAIPLGDILYSIAGWAGLWPGTTIASRVLYHMFVVGIVEELSKWAVFVFVAHRVRPIRSPEDGVVMAAATALAFATIENVRYAVAYGLDVLVIRSVWATTGHMMYAAIWGFVWSALTADRAGAGRRSEFPIALAAVLPVGIVHGLYNSSLLLGPAWGLLVDVATLGVAVAAYRYLLTCSPYRTIPFREAGSAVRELGGALRLNPKSVVLRRARGLHHLRLQDYAAARADFEKASRLAGDRGDALRCLALVAAYAQERSAETADAIHAAYQKLGIGEQQVLMRRLTLALRPNRGLEHGIVGIFAGRDRSAVPLRERRRQAARLRAERRLRDDGERRLAATREAESVRRREELSEADRLRLASGFAAVLKDMGGSA